MNQKSKERLKKITPIAGVLTCIILYSVILIAAIPYVGQQGETYSFWNHFISDLGSIRFSVNHTIYNRGIVLAALGFGTFTFGLQTYVNTKVMRRGVAVGVLSACFCVGVGLVPEDYRIPHLILAVSFFSLAALAAGIVAWSIWREAENPFPRWMAIHGALVPIAFVVFMAMPKELMAKKRLEGALFDRPEIWWLPFFEWVIFLLLTTWIVFASINMWRLQQQQKRAYE